MKKVISLLLSITMVFSLLYIGTALPVNAEESQKVLAEELAGYERISLSDFHAGDGSTIAISAQPAGTEVSGTGITQRYYNGASVESASTYSLNKTYFDFDVNLASSTTAPMYALYERANWYSYLRIKFNNASNQLLLDYVDDNGSTVTSLGTYNLVAFGRTATNEFFNLKVRADFKANESYATLRDAVIQLWINNRFATEVNLTGKNMRDGIWFRPGGETTYVREQKDINEELDGYRRVDMFDYGNKTVGADGVTSFAISDHADSYITDFNKTYLDVDVNYNGNVTWGSHMLQYQASAKYKYAIYLGFDSASTFCLNNYKNASSQLGTKYTFDASEYGIAPNEYFNIKVRTDITNTSATVDTVLVQLWLNNQFACEVTMTFTYAEDVAHDKSHIWTAGAAISVKSAVDTDKAMSGYNRITADDFYNIDGTSLSSSGREFPAARAGEYKKDTDDIKMSYFDADIKMPNGMNPFMAWPSKNKTSTGFYGDGDQIRFYLSGTTLMMMKVHNGANSGTETFADISASPYYYSASDFVNIKIRTTIYGANSMVLAVWVNDHFIKKVYVNTYDAETLADMTCAGFRGTADNTIYVRTTHVEPGVGDTEPVFDSEEHIKTVNYSDNVLNGSLQNFDYYIEDLSDSVVTEYQFNGSAVSANSSTVLALALTEYSVEEEQCFFGLKMTPNSGWNISLFDNSLNSVYNFGVSQNYPDTATKSISDSDYTVTVKTENGAISLWINDTIVLKKYNEYAYGTCTPKVAVYSNASPVSIQIETWCEIDNYNLLGDFVPDLTIDILDLVRMEQVSENVEGLPKIGRYVKAFNNEGSIGTDELTLMARYILGLVNSLKD